MQTDLSKETIPENDDDYEKVVEEVEDEKYGRKRFVVRKVLKAKEQETQDSDANSILETTYFMKRTEDLKLDQNVGTRINVIKDSHKSEHSGFYCQLCDTHVWDSNAWLDHLNGKKHSRLIGMNNKVEKVGISEIKAKFQSLKDAKQQKNMIFESLKEDMDLVRENRKRKSNFEKEEQVQKKMKSNEQDNSQLKQDNPSDDNKSKKEKEENKKENIHDKVENNNQEDEDEEDEDDPETAMMQMLGLPTNFKSKN